MRTNGWMFMKCVNLMKTFHQHIVGNMILCLHCHFPSSRLSLSYINSTQVFLFLFVFDWLLLISCLFVCVWQIRFFHNGGSHYIVLLMTAMCYFFCFIFTFYQWRSQNYYIYFFILFFWGGHLKIRGALYIICGL